MTNNPTIDGVSLLPCPFCGKAPELTKHFRDESYSFMHRCSVLGPISMGFREDPKCHEAVWNTRIESPEVAALQSTIAQLEDKLNKAIDLDFQRRETIEQLQARIAELESGRGEPVAYGCFGIEINGDSCDFVTIESPAAQTEKSEKMMKDGTGMLLVASTPLFTAPPAPVAVVLPSPQELQVLISKAARQADLTSGANYFTAAEFAAIAVIDATAALNEKPTQ
jgi:hypothetical protein